MLHGIDLRGKVDVDWMQKHVMHINEYHDRFKRVTRRFIDRPDAIVTLLATSQCLLHLIVLLSMKPLFREHDICYYIFCLALGLPIICNYY